MIDPEIRNYDGWYAWGINEVRRWRHIFEDVVNRAYPRVNDFGTAVDVGANIGITSYFLAMKFGYIYAFEPDPKNIECYNRNAKLHSFSAQSHLFPYACGEINEHIGSRYIDC